MELSELLGLGLSGLFIIGAVNVATFFRPDITTKQKFALSILVAFLVSFIPAEIGNVIYDKLVFAITAAVAASGGYKIAQKVGGE